MAAFIDGALFRIIGNVTYQLTNMKKVIDCIEKTEDNMSEENAVGPIPLHKEFG